MSKIKNGRELVLRADSHAHHDRIKQGTYGSARVNGVAEYRGCFIGCLSTPHRKRDLFAFLRAKAAEVGKASDGLIDCTAWDDDKQREALKSEFGIPITLSRVFEGIFEGLPTHGAAIEFIPAAARKVAACEGKRITDNQIEAFVARTDGADFSTYFEVEVVEGIRDELFAWLDKRAGVPA